MKLIYKKPDYELYAEKTVVDGLNFIHLTTVHPTIRNPHPHSLLKLHLNDESLANLVEVLK